MTVPSLHLLLMPMIELAEPLVYLHSSTCVCPACSLVIVLSILVCGSVFEYLMEIVTERGRIFTTTADREIVRDVKADDVLPVTST